MAYRIRRTKDLDEVRRLEKRLFPEDNAVDEDHVFWLVTDGDHLPVGFASAVYRPLLGYVFLSRAGIEPSVKGKTLQRRLIRARIKWARMQGAKRVITYTLMKNYPSIVNLLKCGFRFYEPDFKYVGEQVHYMKLDL